MSEPQFIHFTEESNALDYLEKTEAFIDSTKHSPENWKWVIIALHEAVYSFMICALKGTNPDNVCIPAKPGKSFEGKLIGFDEALKRCCGNEWMNVSGFQKSLSITPVQKQSLKLLKDGFRNQFVHYRPTLWSIGLEGMPELISAGLDVLHNIVFEMGSYYVHFDIDDLDNIRQKIDSSKRMLANLQAAGASKG